jgi:hypothetical protein
MNPTFLRNATKVLLPLGLAACSSPTPNLDAHFGQAVTDIQNAQVLRPGAERNAPLPNGMSATSAKFAYDQYQKSFKAPEPKTNAFTIGVGK